LKINPKVKFGLMMSTPGEMSVLNGCAFDKRFSDKNEGVVK
jgi:hypothetical protein